MVDMNAEKEWILIHFQFSLSCIHDIDYFDGLKSQAKDEEISASFHPLLEEPKHGQADEGFWNDWDNQMLGYLDEDILIQL